MNILLNQLFHADSIGLPGQSALHEPGNVLQALPCEKLRGVGCTTFPRIIRQTHGDTEGVPLLGLNIEDSFGQMLVHTEDLDPLPTQGMKGMNNGDFRQNGGGNRGILPPLFRQSVRHCQSAASAGVPSAGKSGRPPGVRFPR